MVKVRLQLLGEGTKGTKAPSPISVARSIVAEGGVPSLYNGISAAWLRQASYATLRLGFFDRFLAFFVERAKGNGKTVGFGERATASLGAGGLAAAIANPSEVALIRMQADGAKPMAERANYKSVVDALLRVGRNEGVSALWSGSYPTIVRVRGQPPFTGTFADIPSFHPGNGNQFRAACILQRVEEPTLETYTTERKERCLRFVCCRRVLRRLLLTAV